MSSIDTSTTEAAWITTATATTSSSRTSSTKTASTITSTTSIWRHLMLATVLLLGLISGGVPGGGTNILAAAEGNIGCLFAETLCLEHLEWCYDDFAFGKCLPQYGLEPEELFRRPLDEDQSRILARMLEELQGAGLGWEHPFTQCRIQGALFAIRTNTDIPQTLCASLAPDPEVLGPQSPLAFVRFTPPNEEYADEVYYPPPKKAFAAGVIDVLPEVIPIGPHTQTSRPQAVDLRELQDRIALDRMLRQYEAAEQAMRQHPPDVTDYLDDGADLNEIADSQLLPFKPDREWAAGASKRGETAIFREQQSYQPHPAHQDIDEERALKELVERLTPNDEADFQYIYPKTSSFREYAKEHHIPKISNFAPENVHQLDGGNAAGGDGVKPKADTPNADKFYKKPHKTHHRNDLPVASIRESNAAYAPPSGPEAGLYTEGGFVYVPKAGAAGVRPGKDDARTLLDNILGFTRRERLDVKKPGPPAAPPPSGQSPSEPPKEIAPADKATGAAGAGAHDGPGSKSKKELFAHTDEDHAPHSVDTEYAHVILKNPIDNWKDGSRIVAALAELLNMQGYFSHPRVDRHEVSFRVESNPDRKTAADVAKQINDSRFKNNLSRRLGVLVIQAGVGDKTKELDSVSSQRLKRVEEGPNVTHVMAYMFAGAGVAAAIVIGMTLFVIRKHDKKKDKLGGLQSGLGRGGCESSSNDYQDLCRARMASGKPGATPSDSPSGGRITALAKESEARPPSSRSSTSSWSEEPALTNMDISTGHMVLSYMEDHLRNKGRLQREWEALCRYEAEPSARDAALQSQCAPLNRAGAPLPYDHSRVVLNHLANAEGMDYINASTITDHDPRAPAYVAAQGPMQATLAHFWQMVWEQGAVVLVALCRLQENGESACARYWPEEGAEVYHIYEVHLVSEHIWCEDYLVRSFYLKNLRTGETRTVTQFHFLSWPQGGVPTSAKALLDFRRKVNKSYRGRSCPIVVHSSNGSGRTGAYILLDLVLGRMNKGAREIDIAATLEHLRDQRAGLVATRQQFEFVLMAVAEEVHAILKALPQTTSAAGKGSQDQENGAKDGQNNGTTAKEETSKDKPAEK
ncbi:receptor-type tyrosine-protein phosphatase N2 [Anopheles darlingi]|uniref:receptor-type tyrosine-protein phosphatase N2 n=1 Tax=Anopheles darlingi TaxID=43151 RepID=UPI0021002532|nr:receptor-type tyrosine-protein phosphatase N2 [Anopheles darlingi]XP_049537286.1 receptor-type tyrosine-protein phosphatase N2 [Anopheles darlingi]XP_049537287.1 receptor-type tyrosine-protein phosphatase N2 [Anopheles darlingi]XP_049537288.1 receptor-type tyrosine-protein phosphatase N2 [Anopheles darlingi]XP_049537289.1 receptor-type tyrosine-protein phosphatase N2 [Anopheles darlingi]